MLENIYIGISSLFRVGVLSIFCHKNEVFVKFFVKVRVIGYAKFEAIW